LVLEQKTAGRESVTGPMSSNPLGLDAALALPLLGLAVYLVFYVSGLWPLGSVQLAPRVFYVGPIPQLAFVAIISLGMSWYAAARTPIVLAGAAVLFVLLSLISIGQNAAVQQLYPPVGLTSLLVTAVSLTASVFTAAAVMLVARSVAPALRRPSYWLVALILWPFIGLLLSSALPIVAANGHLDRSSIQHFVFGIVLVRQCIIFACIGYWLDRGNRREDAISRVF
jgi:hypothetical protein